jgi:hypothetical protein
MIILAVPVIQIPPSNAGIQSRSRFGQFVWDLLIVAREPCEKGAIAIREAYLPTERKSKMLRMFGEAVDVYAKIISPLLQPHHSSPMPV